MESLILQFCFALIFVLAFRLVIHFDFNFSSDFLYVCSNNTTTTNHTNTTDNYCNNNNKTENADPNLNPLAEIRCTYQGLLDAEL